MQARRTAAIIESAKILGIKQLKQKQVEAIESFLSGKDTFVSSLGPLLTSGLAMSLMTVFNSSDSTII